MYYGYFGIPLKFAPQHVDPNPNVGLVYARHVDDDITVAMAWAQAGNSMNVRIANIAASLCLALSSYTASAVELDSDGFGEVLIFPFFNASSGWDTYIDLIFDNGVMPSMLKIHVRDGDTGALVNSFNVYQLKTPFQDPPGHNWRAAISQDENGNPFLTVAEGDCTVSGDFSSGETGADFQLGAAVGTIEVYALTGGLTAETLENVSACVDLVSRWESGGLWDTNPDAGVMGGSVGRVSGSASLVRVEDGLSAGYSAIALNDFADSISHTAPNALSPSLSDANPVAILPNGVEQAPSSGEGVDAVALVLSAGNNGYKPTVTNQVISASGINARTEWVISYPLTGYKSYRPYEVTIDNESKSCETFGLPPENELPTVEIRARDREQVLVSWGGGVENRRYAIDISPEPLWDVEVALCHAVNVVAFENSPSILLEEGSNNVYRISNVLAKPTSSSVKWTFLEPTTMDGIGRPLVGFGLTIFENGTLNGGSVLANYALLKPHIRN